jgi:hypothetical protein
MHTRLAGLNAADVLGEGLYGSIRNSVAEAEETFDRIVDRVIDGTLMIDLPIEIRAGEYEELEGVEEDDLRAWLVEALRGEFAEHMEWQRGLSGEGCDAQRVTDAFRAMDSHGIVAREDFACCQRCGVQEIRDEELDDPDDPDEELGDSDEEPWGFVFYHQQDTGRIPLFVSFDTPDGSDASRTELGDTVVRILTGHGLRVEWNRDPDRRIEVHLADWRKPRHGALAEFPAPEDPDTAAPTPRAPVDLAALDPAEVLLERYKPIWQAVALSGASFDEIITDVVDGQLTATLPPLIERGELKELRGVDATDLRSWLVEAVQAEFGTHLRWQRTQTGETTEIERLTAAFAELNTRGILAPKDFAPSVAGWDEAEAGQRARGRVRFTQDVAGEHHLHLFYDTPDSTEESRAALAQEITAVLEEHRLRPRWDGDPEQAIYLYLWQWRRFRRGDLARYPRIPRVTDPAGGTPSTVVADGLVHTVSALRTGVESIDTTTRAGRPRLGQPEQRRPVRHTARGRYVVVELVVERPAEFFPDERNGMVYPHHAQTLVDIEGREYRRDREATDDYLGAEHDVRVEADGGLRVALVFDVPEGTVPSRLRVSGTSKGRTHADLPLPAPGTELVVSLPPRPRDVAPVVTFTTPPAEELRPWPAATGTGFVDTAVDAWKGEDASPASVPAADTVSSTAGGTVAANGFLFTVAGVRDGITALDWAGETLSAEGRFVVVGLVVENPEHVLGGFVPTVHVLYDVAGRSYQCGQKATMGHTLAVTPRMLQGPGFLHTALVFDLPADATPSHLMVNGHARVGLPRSEASAPAALTASGDGFCYMATAVRTGVRHIRGSLHEATARGRYVIVGLAVGLVGDRTMGYFAAEGQVLFDTDGDPHHVDMAGTLAQAGPALDTTVIRGGRLETALVFDLPEGTTPSHLSLAGSSRGRTRVELALPVQSPAPDGREAP